MFLGYEIKSQQNQAKPLILETDIKLSQAVLDPSKGGKKEPVCLMVEYDKKQFIIAVLDPTRSWQCPLDLMFSAGSEVKFFVKGSGTVHLTGFEYRDDMNSELGFDTSSDEGEEEEPEAVQKSKATEKRASKIEAKSAKSNGVQKVLKKDAKKPVGGDQPDSDDDESDDEDFNSEMMDDDEIDDSDEDDEELDDDLDLDDEDEESEGDED